MAVTRSIVVKHKGYLDVASSPGEGATFTIILPADSRMGKKEGERGRAAKVAGHGTILVMDDEKMVRDVVTRMLASLGYQVVLAGDGAEAIEIYKQAHDTDQSISAAIMDLTIPGGMGGEQAAREILALDKDAKLIVSSGYSNDPVMADFREYGFCAAIQKPYRSEELHKVLELVG